ncbi:MAG: DUF362 domain-containing protein [bacterium]
MKRRDFITKGIAAGVTTSAAFSLLKYNRVLGSGLESASLPYDMVAVKGGEPGVMFDKAILSMGGMKSFVQKNQTVVIKPNIGWDATPERAANTNPLLVKRIVEHCFTAGAKDVYVFDYTCDNWERCYKNSGIEVAVKEAGGKMVPGNFEKYFHEVSVSKGKKLKSAKEHELILESDVFINVPVLKDHGGARLSIAMKNLMGAIWDRRYFHRNDLHQCIADFTTYRKPDLNVVDAYRVLKKNGPRGVSVNDVSLVKAQLISTDIVAVDAAATKIFGLEPSAIGHILNAHQMGVGEIDLSKLNINRVQV